MRTLLCYWPRLNFSHYRWVELLCHCKSIGVLTLGNYTEIRGEFANDVLSEFHDVWKSFVLFIMESLFDDFQLDDTFEEIACLKNSEESILLFSVDANGVSKYSYLLSENITY